jgi:hypothetical protein
MEAFGRNIPDEQYQQMERFLPFAAYASAASQLVFIPILALVVSGLLFAVFSGLMGGDATFKQVFAVVSHAGVVTALQALFSQPLAYARGTLSSSTSLGVFVPFLEETSFVARLLGSIDLFIVWWVITLAIGLGVVYRRRTGPIATTLLLVYVVIAVVIAVVRSALSGA